MGGPELCCVVVARADTRLGVQCIFLSWMPQECAMKFSVWCPLLMQKLFAFLLFICSYMANVSGCHCCSLRCPPPCSLLLPLPSCLATVSQLQFIIRRRISLPAEKAMFFFVGKGVLMTNRCVCAHTHTHTHTQSVHKVWSRSSQSPPPPSLPAVLTWAPSTQSTRTRMASSMSATAGRAPLVNNIIKPLDHTVYVCSIKQYL